VRTADGAQWWYKQGALEKGAGSDDGKLSSTIIVAGAGGTKGGKCNGTYFKSGEYNGKPLYVHGNGKAKIYFSDFWKISWNGSTGGWVYGVNSADGKGVKPPSIWRNDGYTGSDATLCPTLKFGGVDAANQQSRKLVRVQSSYESSGDRELTLKVGDIVKVLREEDTGWWEGELDGRIGWWVALSCMISYNIRRYLS
jgi:hypothetical protein